MNPADKPAPELRKEISSEMFKIIDAYMIKAVEAGETTDFEKATIAWNEARDAILQLFREVAEGAKPSPDKYVKYNSDCLEGYKLGVSDYADNLRRSITSVTGGLDKPSEPAK